MLAFAVYHLTLHVTPAHPDKRWYRGCLCDRTKRHGPDHRMIVDPVYDCASRKPVEALPGGEHSECRSSFQLRHYRRDRSRNVGFIHAHAPQRGIENCHPKFPPRTTRRAKLSLINARAHPSLPDSVGRGSVVIARARKMSNRWLPLEQQTLYGRA